MNRISSILSVALLLVAATAFSQSTQTIAPLSTGGETGTGKAHTTVRLLADVQSVHPGSTFTVGVLMSMDPGWHTYWKNAGEAGLPTTIAWKLPEGISAGEIQWPLPEKHIESGDVLTYGYAGENMLLVPMTASSSLKPGSSVAIKGEVSWLECERMCVPGNASVELRIPVSAAAPASDHDTLFQRYRGRTPRPANEDHLLTIHSTVTGNQIIFRLTPAPDFHLAVERETAPDFFPESSDSIMMGRTVADASAQGATVTLPVSTTEPLARATVVRGVVVYQGTDGKKHGTTVDVPLPADFSSSNAPSEGGILGQSFTAEQVSGGSQPLTLYLLFAFVGGLLLNIMPCVLPVIALKIFGLVKMAGDHPGRVKRLGWSFSSGILASFLVLALLVIILQTAGQQVGWGFQFQEPLFIILMSAVVFAFGLSLFGVYEIRPPSVAVSGVSSVLAKTEGTGKGYAASFSEGVFATILATPCTAPFLGTALGFAFAQPAWITLLIFITVAFGMALPYLILTARPAWLKFLPKPGAWMETAKQVMGFLMMATLLWLLYILGKQLGMEAVIWTAAFLLFIGIACWMIGRFVTLTASRKSIAVTWILALLVVGSGYWLFLSPVLAAREVLNSAPAASALSTDGESTGIPWEPFSLSGLEQHVKENKPVFIDFTAEWCLTCKVNEKTVMNNPEVVEKFRNSGIVPIRADWTNRNPEITRLLAKFGRSGVPLYVIFPAGRPTAPIVLPEVITSGIVIDAITRATQVAAGPRTRG
jgi:thiol:disulfide interchange protein/DsbC/DsbD-like thiol-disulfide interchange protein